MIYPVRIFARDSTGEHTWLMSDGSFRNMTEEKAKELFEEKPKVNS